MVSAQANLRSKSSAKRGRSQNCQNADSSVAVPEALPRGRAGWRN